MDQNDRGRIARADIAEVHAHAIVEGEIAAVGIRIDGFELLVRNVIPLQRHPASEENDPERDEDSEEAAEHGRTQLSNTGAERKITPFTGAVSNVQVKVCTADTADRAAG